MLNGVAGIKHGIDKIVDIGYRLVNYCSLFLMLASEIAGHYGAKAQQGTRLALFRLL
jgi:hypothetical protein